MVSSNFQEKFNWEKTRKKKSKNQNNAFCLPFIVFFTQSIPYQIWKVNTHSILTNNNRTGPPVSESSTRISKFYGPTDSEHKFDKTRIKNWLSISFKLEFPWLETYIYNHYTMFNLQYDGESLFLLPWPILIRTVQTFKRFQFFLSQWTQWK